MLFNGFYDLSNQNTDHFFEAFILFTKFRKLKISQKNATMDENILLYHVKPGDTLDKIGDTIGMTGDQLKDFHNAHCGKMERLWFNNLVGVKQVIIPKDYKSPEQLQKERAKELPPLYLNEDFYADSYSVRESFSNFLSQNKNLHKNLH